MNKQDEKIEPLKNNIKDSDISSFTQGKDELNFAEFPLSLTSKRISKSLKTIKFKDGRWNKKLQKITVRELTITGSDEYGLPTAIDEDVITGLTQLASMEDFQNKKTYFSRYQLINLLGWKHNGFNYKRIKESLNRWLGVTLYYKNAWRDPVEKNWTTTGGFHILENIEIHEPKDEDSPDICSFTWNDIVYSSYQNGNLKNLNFNLYISLSSSITKRMYKFLDKNFFRKKNHWFWLDEFAFDKVGIKRNYTTAQIKQQLNKAIKELEGVGFLAPLLKSERYKKVGKCKWKVFFVKGNMPKKDKKKQVEIDFEPVKTKHKQGNLFDETNLNQNKVPRLDEKQKKIFKKLVANKVSEKKAGELASNFEYEFLEEKIEVLDSMRRKNFRLDNQAGYLIKSIEENWQPPESIKTKYEQKRLNIARKEKELKRQLKQKEKEKLEEEQREAEQKRWNEDLSKVETYLEKMPKKEREDKIKSLIAKSDSFTRKLINQYLADTTKEGMGKACYNGFLIDSFLHLVDKKASEVRKSKSLRNS